MNLTYPSREEARRYRREIEDAVQAARTGKVPEKTALVWPAGLDRGFLVGLPLSEMARENLRKADMLGGDAPLTLHDLQNGAKLRWQSIQGLPVALEAFLSDYIACANTEAKANPDGRLGPAAVVAIRVRRQVDRLDRRGRIIVENRMLGRPPQTLKALAEAFGVSPARIRQIESRTKERIRISFGNELGVIAKATWEDLECGFEEAVMKERIGKLGPEDLGPNGEFVRTLILHEVIKEMQEDDRAESRA